MIIFIIAFVVTAIIVVGGATSTLILVGTVNQSTGVSTSGCIRCCCDYVLSRTYILVS